jgi:hypothetical protein
VSNAELVLIGTLGGAAIGAGATLGVTYVQDRLARRDRRDAELAAAGIDYFAAADRLANQYAQLPPVSETWVHRGIDRLLGKRGATMRARMMNRPVIGDRWEALTDDFLRASARFRLAAPAGLQTSIEKLRRSLPNGRRTLARGVWRIGGKNAGRLRRSSALESIQGSGPAEKVDADRLFLATLDDLEPRLQEGGSEYNVLGIARLLRMLLIDSPSLADKVSRPRNHDVRFTINAREPIWKLFPHEPPPVLWWVGDGFDPERAASVGPKDVAARELLDQLVLLVNEQQITAEHLIRHALYGEGVCIRLGLRSPLRKSPSRTRTSSFVASPARSTRFALSAASS